LKADSNNESLDSTPHILFVVVDDLGSPDLGMLGTGILTPHADELARRGVFLETLLFPD
jgi:arylsulfatase A-like enzyme